jgi:hypothetical protein
MTDLRVETLVQAPARVHEFGRIDAVDGRDTPGDEAERVLVNPCRGR